MKTLISFGATIAFLGLAMASTFAQTQSTTSSSTTYIETSKLVGKKVKSSQGEEVGTIKDVVLDRNTGCMAYTVLSTAEGGARTRGGKMVAVPWAVYSPASTLNELTVTVDRQRIYSAPVFDYARIEEYSRPEYITNVYSYYGVSPGAAVGVGVSGSTTTTGTTTTGAATGAAATAGTTASPAGASSPATTASPAGARSPAATAPPSRTPPSTSPSPHATAATSPHATRGGKPHETVSPSTHGGATGTSPTEKKRGTRGTHEETTPPSGHSETGAPSETQGSTSETERAPSEAASPGEKATGPRHHERAGKHEAATPSERPPGED